MKVLLIEDDPLLGEGLKSFLQSDGYRVDWCQELGQARILSSEPYDAFLLDWQLPDGSAWTGCLGVGRAATRLLRLS